MSSNFFELKTGFERFSNPNQYGAYIFSDFIAGTNDIVLEGELWHVRFTDTQQDKIKDLGIGTTAGTGLRIPINHKIVFRIEVGLGFMVYNRKIEAFDFVGNPQEVRSIKLEDTVVKPFIDLIHGVSIGYNFN